jgi:hypothetical protein
MPAPAAPAPDPEIPAELLRIVRTLAKRAARDDYRRAKAAQKGDGGGT